MNLSDQKKRNPFLKTIGTVLTAAFVVSDPNLVAQDSNENEIFELSPFTVQTTEGSDGYHVTDTLAGSRLRANVKDIGAAITILSKDYMDDLGASDIMEVASFLPSTEAETTQGGPNDGAGIFRHNRVRIRGLFSESVARNYFSAPIGEYMPPSDGYNTDRVTLSAGANSILFGSANPAGIINTQVAPASLGADSTNFRHRWDDEGSQRFEINLNRILAEEKFAIRIAALHEEKEFYRDPQWQDQHRFYGAMVWKPAENTTINLNIEYIDLERNLSAPTVSVDRSGLWRGVGQPTVPIDGVANPSGTHGITRASGGNQTRVIFGSASPIDLLQNWRNYAVSDWHRGGLSNHSNLSVPLDGFMNYDSSMGKHNLDDRKIIIGDFSIEQKIGENFFLQFAGFQNDHQKDIRFTGGNQLYADASETLPDGSPNPNVGDYFYGGGTVENRDFLYRNENYRLTASYDLDLREQAKWAGRHLISGMYQDSKGRRFTDRQRLVNTTPLSGFNDNILNGQNFLRPVFYVDLEDGDRASFDELDLRNFDSQFSELPGVNAEYANFRSGVDTETTQGIAMLAAQSYFFNDRLVTTLGHRIDTQDVTDVTAGNWERNSDGTYVSYLSGINTRTPNVGVSDVEETTYSLGGVFHLVQNQGAVDNFSLSYNRSKNFEPSVADPDMLGLPRPHSTGQTIDYGFKASFFQGKLNGKISWFESSQRNARTSADIFPGAFNNIYQALGDTVDPSWHDLIFNTTIQASTDVAAEGMEMMVNYLPTTNWRIAVFGSQNEAVRSRIMPAALQYLSENRGNVLGHADVLVPDRGNVSVSEVVAEMDDRMAFIQAQDGSKQAEMREWKFSLLTNYNFTEGSLSGFGVGGYLNWQDRPVIGYAVDGDQRIVNINKPFYGGELFDTGLHFSYKQKIWDEKVDWKIQLNIRNLLDDTDPTPTRADEHSTISDVGQNYFYRLIAPRSFILTNNFSW